MTADLSNAHWFKSRRSGSKEACVEVAFIDRNCIGVRDSKDPAGPALVFTAREWDSFTAGVIDGEFNLPV